MDDWRRGICNKLESVILFYPLSLLINFFETLKSVFLDDEKVIVRREKNGSVAESFAKGNKFMY